MADNPTVDNGALTDYKVASDEVTYSGDTANVQLARLVVVEGAEGAKTVTEISTAANGIDVDVTRVQGTVTVDGSGVTQPVSHAALTELAAAIDTEVQVDVVGALPAGDNNIGNVDIASALPTGDNNIGNVDVVSSALPTGASTLAEQQSQTTHLATIAGDTTAIETAVQIMDDWDNAASDGASVSGDVAHDSPDAGEPVKIGAKAETAPSGVTAVADGDRTNLYSGADGILYVRPYCALEDIVSGVDTDTAGDSSSVISAPGAGIRLYITSVIVKNTHASTDAYIDIRDGTGGSVLASIPAPAAGGAIVQFPVPLRLTANTACAVDPSAAVTTIITTVVGFKAAV